MNVGDFTDSGIELITRDTGERNGIAVVSTWKCHCGKYFDYIYSTIKNGHMKSCGCSVSNMLVGEKTDGGIELIVRDCGKRNKTYNITSVWKCHCGNIFEAKFSSVYRGRTKSCGCMRGGIYHYRYNPDTAKQKGYRVCRRSLKNKTLKRDNYTCAICLQQKNQSELIAHHLNGYNWAVAERGDVNNLVTLCCLCHNNFHSIYGFGDNTKEQFEEFQLLKMSNI